MLVTDYPHNMESLFYTRTICAVKDYLKDNGYNLTLNQAVALHDALRFDATSDHIEDVYARTFGYNSYTNQFNPDNIIDNFLRANNIIQSGNYSFSQYVASSKNQTIGLNTIIGDYQTLASCLDPQAEVVDIFSSENVDLSSVKIYLNNDYFSQKDAYLKSHNLNYFPRGTNFSSFEISRNDVILNQNNSLYRASFGFDEKNARILTTIASVDTNSEIQNLYSIGDYKNSLENLGFQELRPYMTSENYSDLEKYLIRDIDANQTNLNNENIHKSIENAKAILQVLNDKGLTFSIKHNFNSGGEIEATVDGLKMDIRLVDLKNPDKVGRLFGDNLISYVVFDDERSQLTAERRVPDANTVSNLLKFRLGDSIVSDTIQDSDGNPIIIGENKQAYHNGEAVYTFNKDRSSSERGNLNTSFTTRNAGTFTTATVQDTPSNAEYKVTPVLFKTELATSDTNVSYINYDIDYAKGRIMDLIGTARGNFKHNVFGTLAADIDSISPDYSDKWNNYRHVAMTWNEKDNYTVNSDGLLINPETKMPINLIEHEDWYEPTDIQSHALRKAYIAYLNNNNRTLGDLVNTRFNDNEENENESEGDIVTFSQSDKMLQIRENFKALSDDLFGHIDKNGKFSINVANIIQYTNVEEADLLRFIQTLEKNGTEIEFLVPDVEGQNNKTFTFSRLKEKVVSFDENSAKDLLNNNSLSDFWQRIGTTVKDTINQSGVTLSELKVDDKGIVHYKGTRLNHRINGTTQNVEGYIGQIFEPDKRGVILTKFNNDANRALIAGYNAIIVPGEGSVEERTRLMGYEQLMHQQIKYQLKNQILRLPSSDNAVTDNLDATKLNYVYRNLYKRSYSLNYERELRSKGFTPEQIEAIVETNLGAVRYNSDLISNSTVAADLRAKKANFYDDRNTNEYSITHRDMTCLEMSDKGYFDRTATATGETQGITRYLPKDFAKNNMVDPVTGKISPIADENAHCALNALDINKFGNFNPPDRQIMSFSNLNQALSFDENVKVVHMTLHGWTMDDANVISKEYAERHPVATNNIKDIEALSLDVFERAINNGTYERDSENPEKFYIMGEEYDCTGSRDYARTIKDTMISRMKNATDIDAVGYRPMTIGDKICDMNGNKGVISLVVDKDMAEDVANSLGIKDEVALFKLNPDLDVVSAPATAPSRFNMGTTRSMMASELDTLILPDGIDNPDAEDIEIDGRMVRGIKGVVGTIPMINTDKTVDEKTHIYTEADFELAGKGRKASSQLAWMLQAKNADKMMERFYQSNTDTARKMREILMAIGITVDKNYNLGTMNNYKPYITEDGRAEERNIIDIKISDNVIKMKNGHVNGRVSGNAVDKLVDEHMNRLSANGGFIELPFPIDMHESKDIKNRYPIITPMNEKTGKYLLPVLPGEYRLSQTFDDGSMKMHKYTREYRRIIEQGIEYEINKKLIEAYQADNIDAAEKIDRIREITGDLAEIKRTAQKRFNRLRNELVEQNFSTKDNIWKKGLMSNPLPNSATAVWTPDPRLGLEEVLISEKTARTLNLRDGDKCIVWRDPLLRPEGIACMVARVQAENSPMELKGAAINPSMDKRYDGDFDGDSVAIVSLNSVSLLERGLYDLFINGQPSDADITAFREKYHCSERRFKILSTPENLKEIENKINDDKALIAEADAKFGIANTLTDLSVTPDKPMTAEDVTFMINDKLDVASGYAVLDDNNKKAVDDCVSIAKQDFVDGKYEDALAKLNKYVHYCQIAAFGSDIIRYQDMKSYFESLNQVIVDHKVKGKVSKFEDIAAYLNVKQTKTPEYLAEHPDAKDDRLTYLWEDGKRSRVDLSADFIDYKMPAIDFNPEKSNIDASLIEEFNRQKQEMIHRFKEVELATAIKKFGTPLAGGFSQKAVKALRDSGVVLDALEITYGATQGILQAKHDAAEARQKYMILEDVLPALWKGQSISCNGDMWIADKDNGKPISVDKKQWVEQYYNLCNDDTNGLNYPVSRERVEHIADALFVPDWSGKEMFINTIDDNVGSTLDVLTYSHKESTLYNFACEGRNLFDTEKSAQFKPNGDIILVNDVITHENIVQEKAIETCQNIGPEMDIENNVFYGIKGHSETVTIPEGIVKVDDYALEGHTEMKNCDLPETLISVGDRAFAQTGLKTINIPDSVKSIGREAFTRCDDMTHATVGQDTMISKDAFPIGCEITRRGDDSPKQEMKQTQIKKIYADIGH